jgi:hypothetical protein
MELGCYLHARLEAKIAQSCFGNCEEETTLWVTSQKKHVLLIFTPFRLVNSYLRFGEAYCFQFYVIAVQEEWIEYVEWCQRETNSGLEKTNQIYNFFHNVSIEIFSLLGFYAA